MRELGRAETVSIAQVHCFDPELTYTICLQLSQIAYATNSQVCKDMRELG